MKKLPSSGFSSNFLVVLGLILCTGHLFVDAQAGRVLLRDVQALTLRRGEYTNGRRSSPVPQLQCTGGTAYGSFSPKVVQCVNRGFDGLDVQWECKSDMSSDYEFGKIEVSCEGYDYPTDPYILAGSCGLNYELDYSASGARKEGSYQKPSAPYLDNSGKGIEFIHVVYFLVACFVIYLIYTSLTSPREGNEGNHRGGGGGPGGGYPPNPPGWRPPPPPPSYDESCNKGGSGNTGTSGGANSSSGPGFFTGMGLGALGGYLFGNRNAGYGNGNSYFRRRNNYGYNQFERDTGFYNDDGPSTSTGYYGGGYRSSGGGGSSGTHTSTGYGGTTRR